MIMHAGLIHAQLVGVNILVSTHMLIPLLPSQCGRCTVNFKLTAGLRNFTAIQTIQSFCPALKHGRK